MTFFKSKREKRLWIAVLLVIIGITAVLFFGRPFAGMLREQGMLSNFFWLAIVLVLATILWHSVKTVPSKSEIGLWIGIIAIYLLMFLRMASPEERSHLIEYSILAIFIHEALKERKRIGGKPSRPAWLALGITIIIGLLDEGIQLLMPNRVFDWFDIFFNTLAASLAIGCSESFAWLRKIAKRKEDSNLQKKK